MRTCGESATHTHQTAWPASASWHLATGRAPRCPAQEEQNCRQVDNRVDLDVDGQAVENRGGHQLAAQKAEEEPWTSPAAAVLSPSGRALAHVRAAAQVRTEHQRHHHDVHVAARGHGDHQRVEEPEGERLRRAAVTACVGARAAGGFACLDGGMLSRRMAGALGRHDQQRDEEVAQREQNLAERLEPHHVRDKRKGAAAQRLSRGLRGATQRHYSSGV